MNSRYSSPVRLPAPRRRAAAALAGLGLALGLLAGCGGDNATTSCDLNACTVTFGGVNASASILGVEARVVAFQNDQVTVEVAGQQATLTVGESAVDVGGFQASLQSAAADKIVVRVARP